MMKSLLCASLVFTSACGTIFNKREKIVYLYDGASIGVQSEKVRVNQKKAYTVKYSDGREDCRLEPEVSTAYVFANLVTGPIGFIVDAITGDWQIIDADECDGVFDEQQQF